MRYCRIPNLCHRQTQIRCSKGRNDFERASSRETRKTASARDKRSSNLFGKTDVFGDFTDAFEQQLLEGLFGGEL